MEYIYLQGTDLYVSRIALGCGFRGLWSVSEAVRTIECAIENGINFIDCANIYRLRSGEYAERALGEAIRHKRDKVVITSKLGAPTMTDDGVYLAGASPKVMEKCLDDTLSRMKTDYLDVYLLHGPDKNTQISDIVDTFNRMIKKGKIRYYGFCNCEFSYISDACNYASSQGLHKPAIVQGAYNLINRSAEADLFPYLNDQEISFMAYSPLAAGLLSNVFLEREFPEKSTWAHDGYYRKYLSHIYKGRILDIAKYLGKLSKEKNCPVSTIAISWIMKNKHCSVCVTGADMPDEVIENLSYASVVFEASELDMLSTLSYGLCEKLTKPYVVSRIEELE